MTEAHEMPEANATPLHAYFGHHRSGSTWLYRVFREVVEDALGGRVLYAAGDWSFDGDLPAARARGDFDFLAYTNADFRQVRGLPVCGIHVVRDPRDLLVSAYYAHAFSHPTDNWPELARLRPLLRSAPAETGLLLELDFCRNVFDDMASWPAEWPGIVRIRFEEMVAAPWARLREAFAHLGFLDRLPEAQLRETVERHNFAYLSGGRRPGEKDPKSHYRGGVAGDWHELFTPAVRWAFEQRYGALLRQYGYERDDTWIEPLPR